MAGSADHKRRLPHPLVLVAGGLLLLAAGVLTALAAGGSTSGTEHIPTGATADALAAESCDHLLVALPRQIAEDASAEDVLAGIRRAEQLARAAAQRDPRWVSLAGGAGALRESLTHDDAGAASVAVRSIRASCAMLEADGAA